MEIHTQNKKSRRDPSTDRRFVRLRPPATLPADMSTVPEWFPGYRDWETWGEFEKYEQSDESISE